MGLMSGMNRTILIRSAPPVLFFASVLFGCGGSPPPAVAEPVAPSVTCEAFQELRDGACVYTVEEEGLCMEGHAADCTVAGHIYLSGEVVEANDEHAAELYQRGCRGDDAEACGDLGGLYEAARGVPEDLAEAARLYAVACELGDGASCTNLGVLVSEGRGAEHDPARAAGLFERSCGEGDTTGCAYLGMAYIEGAGVAQNLEHGIELYERACDANVAFACNNLATVMEFNPAVPLDAEHVMELYELSCGRGLAWGCFNVGRAYGEGTLVALDLERARTQLAAACAQEVAPACRLAQSLETPAPTAEQTASSCTAPAALTLGREVTGTTEGATNGLTATCGLTAASPERVYTLRVTRPTRVKVDLFSAFDGVVHIRSACSADAATQVACNDDVRGDSSSSSGERHSSVEVDLARGTYFVVVDGYGASASGTYRLRVDRAPAP